MIKQQISPRRLRAIKRVEDHIAAHPGASSRAMEIALGILPTTLNAYTRLLRDLGRITAARRSHMTQPECFTVVAQQDPLRTDTPIRAPRNDAPPIQLRPAVRTGAPRWCDALFGAAEGMDE